MVLQTFILTAKQVCYLWKSVLQPITTLRLRHHHYFIKWNGSIGVRHGNYILVVTSLLLLVREAFTTVTVKSSTKQSNEHFWYPLLAVPEIFTVILFPAPGQSPRVLFGRHHTTIRDTIRDNLTWSNTICDDSVCDNIAVRCTNSSTSYLTAHSKWKMLLQSF